MAEDILVRLRLAGEQFQREVDSALAGVPAAAERAGEESGESFARGMNKRAAAIGAAVAAGAVLVQQAIERSLEYAAELDETSKSLNYNAEALQGLRHAAADAGVGTAQLEEHLSDLHQRIEQATGGGREAQQMFVDLGVGFQTLDGHARETDVVFSDLIDRLADIEDPLERARVGNQLLGDEYARMAPLLHDGADGLRAATDELMAMNGALSADEIAKLQDTNAKLEDLKNILSVNVAQVVADNADAIMGMAEALGWVASRALAANSALQEYYASSPQGRQMQMLGGNPVGAMLGVIGDRYRAANPAQSFATPESQRELERALAGIGVAEPELSPERATASRRGGGSPRRAAAPRQSAEDRAREQAIRAAQRAEEDFEEAIQKTLSAQADSVRVEEARRELGEAAAAAEEVRLNFQRQNPMAVHQTVEALTVALGITRELTEAERAHYSNLIASADAAEDAAAAAAERAVAERGELARKREDAAALDKAQADMKAAVDEQRQWQEDAVRDVADLYENLFTGNTNKIWGNFKDQGLRMVADIAAQWTLALISGQTGGAQGAGAPGGKLGLLSSAAGLIGGNSATTPGAGSVAGLGNIASLLGLGGKAGAAGAANPIAAAIAAVPGLNVAIAAAAVTHVVGEGIEKFTGLRFDALGGLFGGLIGGFAVGALKGAVKGNATIGADGDQLGVIDQFGKKKFRDQAVNDATGIMDTLEQIAQGLGVDINAAAGSVSIGTRNGKYRVDPLGGGALKPGQGAIDFGKDQQAALEYAIRNLIEDGVLGPISEASRTILTAGGDLQRAIEKAVMIESVPRLLKQRLDPLGAKLEEIDDQFRKLADALDEGGGSAEQIAQARKLWQLEREDAIKQIGEASAGLKDFLASLNAGPNSPLSLRQQQAEAEKALAPYVASIEEARAATAEVERLKAGGGTPAQIAAAEEAARAAAAGVDQGGFQNAAQQVLGLSRQINGSSGGFFADFDRIRALTGGAIGAIDGAASNPGAGRDPFTELTAKNTGDIAAMIADTNRLLVALNDNVAGSGSSGLPGRWLDQNLDFASGS